MNQKAIWTYPWDLIDTDMDTIVSQLAEEIGINTISLATAYHSVEHLRPRANGGKIFCSAKGDPIASQEFFCLPKLLPYELSILPA